MYGSTPSSQQYTFQGLARRYLLDYSALEGAFTPILEHLKKQDWNPQKWNRNVDAVFVAVFCWVCREMQVRRVS